MNGINEWIKKKKYEEEMTWFEISLEVIRSDRNVSKLTGNCQIQVFA